MNQEATVPHMIHSVAYGSASKRANQKITDISDLIYDSYKKYNSLSTSTIEKLRFKHRIKVVQNLEENAIKNVIRSVQSNSFVNFYLTGEEIHEFYALVKESILRQQFYGQHIKGLNLSGDNDTTPLYENIKIDFDSFKGFFAALSSWSSANNMERLALRVFKFADDNNDNLINFLEFLILMVLLTKSDIESRLKLFFCMHQIPLPKDSQLYLEDDSPEDGQTPTNPLVSSKVVLEIGTEANEELNFFEINDEIAAEASESIVNYSEFEHCSNMSSTSSAELVTYDYPKMPLFEILPPSLSKSASPGQSPMYFFNRRMDSREDGKSDSPSDSKKLPTLNLTQFYQLWSTLYDLFDNEECRLGQTIKKFGLHLLDIAETAAKEINFEAVVQCPPVDLSIIKQQPKSDLKSEQKSELLADSSAVAGAAAATPSSFNLDATSTDSFEMVSNQNEQKLQAASQTSVLINELDVQHAITIHYTHFKASLLIEEPLSSFFEKVYETDELFNRYRNNQQNERTANSFSSKE